MKTSDIYELECHAMHYDWGKKGKSSLVARLLGERAIDPLKPYAELWMGVHPKGPSRVKIGNGILLSEVLHSNPELLGEYTKRRWGVLPFLFKVLSIAHPLSVQLHPDKEWAESLHSKDPVLYPDANHKPEMTLALSRFKILYGFENKTTLLKIWQQYPCLTEILQENYSSRRRSSGGHSIDLEKDLPLLLMLPEAKAHSLLKALQENILQKIDRSEADSLFLDLFPHYPNDPGLLFLFLMQKVEVAPQCAISLRTNQLHSYLGGDVVECMASSDNVIRAGITNKFKDVAQMMTRLSCQHQPPELHTGFAETPFIRRYPSTAEEFELQTIQLSKDDAIFQGKTGTPSIFLVLSGKGSLHGEDVGFDLEAGRVLFIGAQQSYSLSAIETLYAVKAYVPLPIK